MRQIYVCFGAKAELRRRKIRQQAVPHLKVAKRCFRRVDSGLCQACLSVQRVAVSYTASGRLRRHRQRIGQDVPQGRVALLQGGAARVDQLHVQAVDDAQVGLRIQVDALRRQGGRESAQAGHVVLLQLCQQGFIARADFDAQGGGR